MEMGLKQPNSKGDQGNAVGGHEKVTRQEIREN